MSMGLEYWRDRLLWLFGPISPLDQGEMRSLERALLTLEPAPEGRLTAGRARMLAEEARWRQGEPEGKGRFRWGDQWSSWTSVGAAVAFATVLVAAWLFPLWGASPSGMLSASPSPVMAASATLAEPRVATASPTPAFAATVMMPHSAFTPQPATVPEPQRGTEYTVTRAAPPLAP